MRAAVLVLVAACNGDDQLKVINDPPTAAILSPIDGETLIAGAPILIEATISDDITANDELGLVWTSSVDGSLRGEEARDGSNVSLLVTRGLTVGSHTLSLQVTDEEGEQGEATRAVELVPNAGPVVELLEPQEDDAFDAGTPVTVVAQITDDLDVIDDLTLIWSSSLAGQLNGEPQVNGNVVSLYLEDGLEEGTHALELVAYDTLGAEGADTVQPVFSLGNEPPVIDLYTPLAEEQLDNRENLHISGAFLDDRTDPGSITLSWTGTAASILTTETCPRTPDSSGGVDVWLRLDGCDNNASFNEFILDLQATDAEGAFSTLTRRFYLRCDN